MAIAAVICVGIGPGASIPFLLTEGYGISSAPAPPVVVGTGEHHEEGGSGRRPYAVTRKKRRRGDVAFTLGKDEPATAVVEPPAAAPPVPSSELAAPSTSRPLAMPPVAEPVMPKRALAAQRPPDRATDRLLAEAQEQAKARDLADDQDDEETILAWLMSL